MTSGVHIDVLLVYFSSACFSEKTRLIGLSKEKFLDFVEGRS